jgi:hypothetical protein
MPTPDREARPPLVVLPRAYWRATITAAVLLGIAAVIGSPIAALNALDSHEGLNAVEDELDVQRDQNDELQQQLDCRYVLSTDVSRLHSAIFVTTAQALSAARRRDTAAVDLLTTHLDRLAEELEVAAERRLDAVDICDTEPENVLG